MNYFWESKIVEKVISLMLILKHITKSRYWNKPSSASLEAPFVLMKQQYIKLGVWCLAMLLLDMEGTSYPGLKCLPLIQMNVTSLFVVPSTSPKPRMSCLDIRNKNDLIMHTILKVISNHQCDSKTNGWKAVWNCICTLETNVSHTKCQKRFCNFYMWFVLHFKWLTMDILWLHGKLQLSGGIPHTWYGQGCPP